MLVAYISWAFFVELAALDPNGGVALHPRECKCTRQKDSFVQDEGHW